MNKVPPSMPTDPVATSPSSSMPLPGSTYALPLEEWDRMVGLANHLAKRESEMPLKRRMQRWLDTAAREAALRGMPE